MVAGSPFKDLFARVGLRTDKPSVNRVKNELKNVKRQLAGIGTLVGASFGVKSLLDFSDSLDATRQRLRDTLSGLDDNGDAFKRIQATIDDVEKSVTKLNPKLDKVFPESSANQIADRFFKSFGFGEEQLESFNKILEFSAKQAVNRGKDIQAVFGTLQDAITTGQAGGIVEFFPNIDEAQRLLNSFRETLQQSADPTGLATLGRNLDILLKQIEENGEAVNRTFQAAPDGLIQAINSANKLEDTVDKVGNAIRDNLAPGIEAFGELIEKIGTTISQMENLEDAIPTSIKRLTNALFDTGFDIPDDPDAFVGPPQPSGRNAAGRRRARGGRIVNPVDPLATVVSGAKAAFNAFTDVPEARSFLQQQIKEELQRQKPGLSGISLVNRRSKIFVEIAGQVSIGGGLEGSAASLELQIEEAFNKSLKNVIRDAIAESGSEEAPARN